MKHRDPLHKLTLFDVLNVIFLGLVALVTVFPIWNVLMISLNEPSDTNLGGLYFWFRKFTLQNFAYFFMEDDWLRAMFMSVARTVLGAVSCVLFTAAFSYGVSKKYLIGHKYIIGYLLLTMYISGGMIPMFLLIKNIGLYKSFLVYIIPELMSNYYAIIMITYFRTIPAELEESVKIDGGNDLTIFARIILPVSKPIIFAVGLFVAVYQWNAWFDTILYGSKEIMTLQAKLVEILRDAAAQQKLLSSGAKTASLAIRPTLESIKATATVITIVPMLALYPFLQKYFVKGIMVGSLKG